MNDDIVTRIEQKIDTLVLHHAVEKKDLQQRLTNTQTNEARVREHYLTQNDQLRAFVGQVAGDTRWGVQARQLLRRLDK